MGTRAQDIKDIEFPKSDTEADERFEKYRENDPLPEVPAALLNAGDIYDYACIAGMIRPFATDEPALKQKLKPASYEIDFLGTVHYLDERGEHHKVAINRQTPFTLKKNAIVFVSLACKLRLPSYIAMRFNLRIKHVHRGLLLGTGPLVDPGFVGRLLIPLHNLTDKDYTLIGGEGLIWVEFTKLAPPRAACLLKSTPEFPETKWNLTAQEYFNAASHGKPAVSSIPGEVALAIDNAKKAQDHAEKADKFSKRLVWSGSLALVLSLGSVLAGTWNLIQTANKNITDFRGTLDNVNGSQRDLLTKVQTLETEIQTLRNKSKTSR